LAGVAVQGRAEPAVFYHQHNTHQPRPAVFAADHGQDLGPQSSGDGSQLLVPGGDSLQLTVPQTMAMSDSPSSSSSSVVSESQTSAPANEAAVAAVILPLAPTAVAESSDITLANIKEKTPMCLINELARFNKVCAFCQVFFKFATFSPLKKFNS